MPFSPEIHSDDKVCNLADLKHIIENILGKYINDKAIFIDDLYEHLEPCKGINNLKLIQANWGYVHDNEKSPYLLNEHETIEKLKGKI